MNKTFEQYLQEWFIKQNEFGGIPITKDNCEDLFEQYTENLDGGQWTEFAEIWGKIQFIEGEKAQINKRIGETSSIK